MPSAAEPAVAVVVPARSSAGTIEATLRAILAQDLPDPIEVVVAVAPSTDGTAEVVDRVAATDPRVRRVDNPEGTAPAGLNLAVAATRAPVVARVDAHAVIPPGYLRRAVELLAETGADNVGGIQDAVGETPFEQAVAAAMRSPLGSGGAAYRGEGPAGPVDTVYLGVFRRTALERVGGFDPTLLRNQDYELNVRLRATGGTVWFSPELRVRYRPRGTVRALARQYLEYGRWKREVLRRHPGSLRLRQLAAPVLVLGAAAGVLALPWTRGRSAVVPAGYGALVALGGVRAAPPGLRVRTAVALATMHLAWGVGFLGRDPRVTGRT
jgi:succinoglycan biosynthesis protein ExoA